MYCRPLRSSVQEELTNWDFLWDSKDLFHNWWQKMKDRTWRILLRNPYCLSVCVCSNIIEVWSWCSFRWLFKLQRGGNVSIGSTVLKLFLATKCTQTTIFSIVWRNIVFIGVENRLLATLWCPIVWVVDTSPI